jgi:hypothetical protein
MPLAVVTSKHCNDYAFHPTNSAVRTIEAWVPDIASQFRNDESSGISLSGSNRFADRVDSKTHRLFYLRKVNMILLRDKL